MNYYLKELISNKLWLRATGAPITFEPVGDDQGVLATDNPVIIAELDQAIARHIGGVSVIDQEQYDNFKKKALANPSLLNSLRDRAAISGLMFQQPQGVAPVAIEGVRIHGQMSPHLRDLPKTVPEPITVPTEFVRPKVARGFFKKSGGGDAST